MSYKTELHTLQIHLTQLQRHLIQHDHQIAVIFEGRDASGKDGVIKRITQHLSPRETRIVALPVPSDRDRRSWYFQRYTPHLPARKEMVLFNRSWYNRAGVERVMGFCTDEEYDAFMESVPVFEQMLTSAGIQILKYYLDVSKEEQKLRLDDRAKNPLKQWKSSPIDAQAQQMWSGYSDARNTMLARTHTSYAPWIVVNANDKKMARLNIIADILHRVDCPSRERHAPTPDQTIVRPYDPGAPDTMLYP